MAKTFSQFPVSLAHAQNNQKILVTLVDETDVLTLETGVSSPTLQISKNGSSYASLSDGTWAEIGQGDYTVRLDDTDTNTLGWAVLRIIKSGTTAETKILVYISVSMAEQRQSYQRQRIAYRRE